MLQQPGWRYTQHVSVSSIDIAFATYKSGPSQSDHRVNQQLHLHLFVGAVPSQGLVSCVVAEATPGLDSVRGSNRRSSDNVECPFTVRNSVIPMDRSICTSTCISKANLAMTEPSTPSRVTLGVDLAISRKIHVRYTSVHT